MKLPETQTCVAHDFNSELQAVCLMYHQHTFATRSCQHLGSCPSCRRGRTSPKTRESSSRHPFPCAREKGWRRGGIDLFTPRGQGDKAAKRACGQAGVRVFEVLILEC